LLVEYEPLFKRLARVEGMTFLGENEDYRERAASVVVGNATLYLPLAGMVDLEAELTRLNKEVDGLAAQLERSQGLLNTPSFVERARPEVVERERAKLADLLAREEALRKRIASLKS